MFQLVRTQFCSFVSSALAVSAVMSAPAFGEEAPPNATGFTCFLEHANGEVADVVLKIGDSNTIELEVNTLRLRNVVALTGHSHSPSLAFSSNMDGRGVYTLVVHRDFFRPHPESYDPSNPPATLTIQHANSDLVPKVDVFWGNCRFI